MVSLENHRCWLSLSSKSHSRKHFNQETKKFSIPFGTKLLQFITLARFLSGLVRQGCKIGRKKRKAYSNKLVMFQYSRPNCLEAINLIGKHFTDPNFCLKRFSYLKSNCSVHVENKNHQHSRVQNLYLND